MKKIILISISIIFTLFSFNSANSTVIRTTAEVPGANCSELGKGQADGKNAVTFYECDVNTDGASAIIGVLGKMIKYATYIAGLFGVMFIVYNGILYSMGGLNEGSSGEAKKRIIKTLIGLIILLMSGYILQFIAPWVYK